MSLDNHVEPRTAAIDHVHYHQCGASAWDLGVFPREHVVVENHELLAEVKRLVKLGKLDLRTMTHRSMGLKYLGKFKDAGCGYIWKHNELVGLGDEKAHLCPKCGYFESYALEKEDLEALGLSLDSVPEYPHFDGTVLPAK